MATNPYLALLEPTDEASTFRASTSLALDRNPDAEATARRVASYLGTVPPAVKALPKEAERAAQIKRLTEDTAAAPVLRQRYTDADWAALAHDDSGPLAAIETAVSKAARYVTTGRGGLGGDALAAVFRTSAGMAGVGRAGLEFLAMRPDGMPANRGLQAGIDWLSARGAEAEAAAKSLAPAPDGGIVSGGVSAGVQSFISNALMLPLALLPGGQGAALAGMSASTGGQAYQQARDKGLPVGQALPFAASQAAIEYATEKLPLSRLIGDVKAGTPILQTLTRQVAAEVPGEQAATVLQDLNEWAVLNPDKPFASYLAERPSAAAQTLIATIVGVGGNVALTSAVQAVADRAQGVERRAEQAPQAAQALAELTTLAEASKLRERDPQAFQVFAQELTEQQVPALYVDAQVLQQSGVDLQAVAQALPAVAAQVQRAIATGGDLVIPTAEFLTLAPGQQFVPALVEHARTAADAMSAAEAKRYMTERGDALQAEVAQVLAEREQAGAQQAERDAIRDQFAQQLQGAGRTADVAQQEATALAAFYSTQAGRLGVTPSELAARYPLQVQRGQAGGAGVLEQSAAPDTPAFRAWFGDSKVVDAEGRPLVVYHGSGVAFDAFDSGRLGENTGSSDAEIGFHFSDNAADAGLYADMAAVAVAKRDDPSGDGYGAKGVVRPFYLSLKNPLVVGADESEGGAGARTSEFLDDKLAAKRYAEANGHDGIVYLHGTNVDAGYTAIAFRPEQIKSATGNRGTFDPNSPSILEQQARGQIALQPDITQAPSVITLFKGADLSTVLHEAGHFFLAAQADMAARIDGQQRDGATVTLGEQQIMDDARTTLAWFGITDTPEASALTQWLAMPLEQQREHHEKFARGFEAYAFEGRAPSVELQGVFQRFRAWLVQVYRQLRALNVELTDDIRGVMDRMLASEAEIEAAQAARQMGPLFGTAEQAGMTPEQWAQYNGLAADATAEAIQRLQARGLRDMKWFTGARSRKLKELQRAAAGLRREVEREVRVEVMSQPVYRAWQFLTGKGDAQDMAQAADKPDPQALDVTRDSLLVAIAKMGGINRASAARDLSLSEDYFRTESGVFGKPVFRKDGGMGADDMAGALLEAHYLLPDDQGKHSLADLEAAIQDELSGTPRYSLWHNYQADVDETQVLADHVLYGRLSTQRLREMYGTGTDAIWRTLSARRMTSDSIGIEPQAVADRFEFDSVDAMVRALAEAQPPADVIRGMTDQRMLERFGDLATPEGLERAADDAIHNEARARFIAAELDALQRAGQVREDAGADPRGRRRTVDVLARAAREYAAGLVAQLRVRDIRPAQYEAAAARAARQAQQAVAKGDTAAAAAAQRNRLIQHEAARAATEARDEVQRAVEYFRRFDRRAPGISAEYMDQIEALLERFDLRQSTTLRAIDKRRTLVQWVESQREQGMEPDIPAGLLDEAQRKSFKEMTVEEVRGLRDAVKQIEHLGRTKQRLLTSRAQKAFEAVRDEIADSIETNARGRQAETRTAATAWGKTMQGLRWFRAAHIKAAIQARIMDGGKDGGPVWEYFVRPANERGDMEASMRADATARLHAIVEPLLKAGRMTRSELFPSIGRSMTREQVIGMALNTGNAGNWQRMLGGEGWSVEQVRPVLATLTAAEWQAVQQIWDLFESYRPQIGAKERRVYGVEPQWVEAVPLEVSTSDGQTLSLRGGYYPINYDPLANARAEQHADAEDAKRQMQGAYTSATTRRGFTKSRVEEVQGRPLMYSLTTVYGSVNDVIHDLAWHEWLIDVNKLLRSDKIDQAIRQHYGPAAVKEMKRWVEDIATGDRAAQRALEMALGRLRRGASIAGMGFNVMSAAMQPLGFSNSVVRIGAQWVGRGVMRYIGGMRSAARDVNERSEFMRNRARTRFRELDEIANRVEGKPGALDWAHRNAFWLMLRVQQVVDYPTWLGAYEKAIAEGNVEERAVALADQAVIDSQGGGQTKDLAGIERGGPVLKLFTTFYSYMNTTLNLGVAQTMAADTPAKKARLASDYLLLFTVPAALGAVLKSALTPGDSGDWEEWDKALQKLLAEQLSFLFGTVVVAREFSEVAKTLAGVHTFGYTGPGGLRVIPDAVKLAQQAAQGEFDDSLRKSAINLVGSLFGLPAAQINRSITGAQALAEGETENPAALVFGYQEPR